MNIQCNVKLFFIVFSIVLAACQASKSKETRKYSETRVQKRIGEQIDSLTASTLAIVSCNDIQSKPLILEFYKTQGNTPVWVKSKGLSSLGDTLLVLLKQSYKDGFDSMQYHVQEIEALRNRIFEKKGDTTLDRNMARIDILMTDAFFTYASQQYAGCIHNAHQNVEWKEHISGISLTDSLQKVIKDGQLRNMITHFTCNKPQYLALKKNLLRYIDIRNRHEWIMIPEDTHLKKGDKGPDVVLLNKRLALTEDNINVSNNDSVFDDKLEEAVKGYERRHALPDTGTIGNAEVRELNTSVDERIKQIELNMERCRWLPPIMQQPYVMVNIAGFNLAVVDSNEQKLTMRIVVGKKYRQTPLFKGTITYITLNPSWEIPESIVKKEILPAIKKNKNYLVQKNIKIYSGWQKDAKELSSASINWDSISPTHIPFRFSQTPGPWNSLGTILFRFPNKYDVYLHDTPSKSLFLKPVRAYSHGCIRIEKPLDLAVFLLRDNTGWTKERIMQVISSDKQVVNVVLKKPVDVYVCYWTAWADDKGAVSFAPDVYGYDQKLYNELHSCGQVDNEVVKK